MDLIKENKFDGAETVSKRLLHEYPDQIDGFHRLGQVCEAQGKRHEAGEYYRKAADFARTMSGLIRKLLTASFKKPRN